ncbi:hypothetical protein ACTNCI_06155 [Mitsuokella jalaludinii]|uniref:hypothetical protein n=1 Tax=Mitsuokella jalaludinii TaxID=187979 RepID=UPI003F8B2380
MDIHVVVVQLGMADSRGLLKGSGNALDAELRVFMIEECIREFPVILIILIDVSLLAIDSIRKDIQFVTDLSIFFADKLADIRIGYPAFRIIGKVTCPVVNTLVQYSCGLVTFFR